MRARQLTLLPARGVKKLRTGLFERLLLDGQKVWRELELLAVCGGDSSRPVERTRVV